MIDESEQRIKVYIDNLPPSVHQKWQDSWLSGILKQIQDLAERISKLSNTQPNDDQLRKKVGDIENEVKRIQSDLAALLRRLAQQPTPIVQPPLPLPSKKDEDFQAIMPFIEVLPTFNLFEDGEWV